MSSTTTLADVANKIAAVVNRGAWNGSITTSGGSVTIPVGYHNGSGKVTGPTLASLIGTNVTATSNAHILSGYTAYGKNGVKYTGSDKGYTNGYNTGVTAADNRANANSVNYQSGYNAGVAASRSIFTPLAIDNQSGGDGQTKSPRYTIGPGQYLLICSILNGESRRITPLGGYVYDSGDINYGPATARILGFNLSANTTVGADFYAYSYYSALSVLLRIG